MTSVSIPGSVASIGKYAFQYCENLKKVNITDLSSWLSIGFGNYGSNPLGNGGALYLNGAELKVAVIPDGVTKINDYAFQGCTGMTSVSIPGSVTSIGNYAFSGCGSLNVINALRAEACKAYKNTFGDDTYSGAQLNVPIGSLPSYQNADGWNRFKNIQEKVFSGVEIVVVDDAVKVTAAPPGEIRIDGADEDCVAAVYTIGGRLVYSGAAKTIAIAVPGIYIVRVASQVTKVIVK